MIELNELQQDMLIELFNLGMGSAASALSEMVSEEVLLSVPEIRFMEKAELTKMLAEASGDQISGVSQNFHGMLLGKALLTFPSQKSLELVRLLLQDTVPVENLTEFEEEALLEIGNIIINAGLSSLADIFEDEITSDLPIFNSGRCTDVIENKDNDTDLQETVLYLQVNFTIELQKIQGYVIYLLNIESMENLAASIDNYLAKLTG